MAAKEERKRKPEVCLSLPTNNCVQFIPPSIYNRVYFKKTDLLNSISVVKMSNFPCVGLIMGSLSECKKTSESLLICFFNSKLNLEYKEII